MPPNTEGFIKLHRKIKESPIYRAPAKCRFLWYEILLRATWEEGDYDWLGPNKIDLEPGELLESQSDMADWIEASKPTVGRYLELMEDEEMIETHVKSRGKYRKTFVRVLNWDKYQNKNNTKKDETVNETQDKTQDDGCEVDQDFNHEITTCTKEVKECEECQKHYIKEIFEHWNEVGAGTSHQKISGSIKRHVGARLKDGYEVDYIKKAIANLAEAYKNDEYYWSHKWGLDTFCKRGGGTKMENFHGGIEHLKDKEANNGETDSREKNNNTDEDYDWDQSDELDPETAFEPKGDS
jgi:DNA-binding transcriptional regulator YhcF (GntR family)